MAAAPVESREHSVMQQDLMPGLGQASGMPRSGQIKIHGPDAFEGMRRAGTLGAATLDFITPHVQPGVTKSSVAAASSPARRMPSNASGPWILICPLRGMPLARPRPGIRSCCMTLCSLLSNRRGTMAAPSGDNPIGRRGQ